MAKRNGPTKHFETVPVQEVLRRVGEVERIDPNDTHDQKAPAAPIRKTKSKNDGPYNSFQLNQTD